MAEEKTSTEDTGQKTRRERQFERRDFNSKVKEIGTRAYEILGVPENASADALQAAYRKQSLTFHPDRYRNASTEIQNEMEERFKELGKAFALVGDPETRNTYDSYVQSNPSQQTTRAQRTQPKTEPAPNKDTAADSGTPPGDAGPTPDANAKAPHEAGDTTPAAVSVDATGIDSVRERLQHFTITDLNEAKLRNFPTVESYPLLMMGRHYIHRNMPDVTNEEIVECYKKAGLSLEEAQKHIDGRINGDTGGWGPTAGEFKENFLDVYTSHLKIRAETQRAFAEFDAVAIKQDGAYVMSGEAWEKFQGRVKDISTHAVDVGRQYAELDKTLKDSRYYTESKGRSKNDGRGFADHRWQSTFSPTYSDTGVAKLAEALRAEVDAVTGVTPKATAFKRPEPEAPRTPPSAADAEPKSPPQQDAEPRVSREDATAGRGTPPPGEGGHVRGGGGGSHSPGRVQMADEAWSKGAATGLTTIHAGKALYYAIKGDTEQALLEGEAAGSMFAVQKLLQNERVQIMVEKGVVKGVEYTAEAIGRIGGKELSEKLLEKVGGSLLKIGGREIPIVGGVMSLGFSVASAARKDNFGDGATEILSGGGEAVLGTAASFVGMGFLGGELGRETMNGLEYITTFGAHSGDPSLTRMLMSEGLSLTSAITSARMLPYIEKGVLDNQSNMGVRVFTLSDGHQAALPQMNVESPKIPAEVQGRMAGINGASENEVLYRMMGQAKQEKISMNPFGGTHYADVHDTLSAFFHQQEVYEDSARMYIDYAKRFNEESRPKIIAELNKAGPYLNGRKAEDIVPVLDDGTALGLHNPPKITKEKYPDVYAFLKENVNEGIDVDALSPKQQHHLLREALPLAKMKLSSSDSEGQDRIERIQNQRSEFLLKEYIPYTERLKQYQLAIVENDAKTKTFFDEANTVRLRAQVGAMEENLTMAQKETGIDLTGVHETTVYQGKQAHYQDMQNLHKEGKKTESDVLTAKADMMMVDLRFLENESERIKNAAISKAKAQAFINANTTPASTAQISVAVATASTTPQTPVENIVPATTPQTPTPPVASVSTITAQTTDDEDPNKKKGMGMGSWGAILLGIIGAVIGSSMGGGILALLIGAVMAVAGYFGGNVVEAQQTTDSQNLAAAGKLKTIAATDKNDPRDKKGERISAKELNADNAKGVLGFDADKDRNGKVNADEMKAVDARLKEIVNKNPEVKAIAEDFKLALQSLTASGTQIQDAPQNPNASKGQGR
jgi:hypothetical protein